MVSSPGKMTGKNGWLRIYKILVRKKRKIAMNSKRHWKRYWASLTGISLLLHHNEDSYYVPLRMGVELKIGLSLSLAHPVHDYIEKDYVFSLSTANGSTYYLQTISQLEVENWISAIHCAAAMAMTIDNSREKSIENIENKIKELNSKIEKERKEKLSSINIPSINVGAIQYDDTAVEVERCSVEIYRLESYLAALRCSEPPNSRALLGLVSKSTKYSLRKLGLFSIASLHAFVSTRYSSHSTSFSPSSIATGDASSSGGFHFGYGSIKFRRQRKDPSTSSTPERPEKAHKPSLRDMEISGPFPMVLSPSTLMVLNRLQQSDTEGTSDSDFPSHFATTSSTQSDVTQDSTMSPKLSLVGNNLVGTPLQNDVSIKFEQTVQSLICPAPPTTHTELSLDVIQNLTVPTPPTYGSTENVQVVPQRSGDVSKEMMGVLIRVPSSEHRRDLISQWEANVGTHVAWTTEDRLRKCAQDLVDTEREYVLLLQALVDVYLSPLKTAMLLPPPDMEALVGDIPDILQFQNQFLHKLEEALKLEVKPSEDENEENTCDLMPVVSTIADTFLHHMDDFKRYSSFCSALYIINHILALDLEGSTEATTELRQFLEARNPQNDHTSTLPSLLAKPIVRISRYPLFLNSMLENISQENEERHLQSAVDGMVKVANHINEMQRVSETYTELFSIILREYMGLKSDINLNVSQLCFRDELMWLNPLDDIKGSKQSWKKGKGPPMLCFVFSSAVVLICLDKKTNKRDSSKVMVSVFQLTQEETKLRVLFPIEKCVIVDLPDSDGVTNMWQLRIQYKTTPTDHLTSYLLRSQSPEKKSKVISHILQQSTISRRKHRQSTSMPAS